MKAASRSGFLVFLGGIFAARNVVHVRAAPTLQPPPSANLFDLFSPTASLLHQAAYIESFIPWLPHSFQNFEGKRVAEMPWNWWNIVDLLRIVTTNSDTHCLYDDVTHYAWISRAL